MPLPPTLLPTSLLATNEPKETQPPNILWLCADHGRFDILGCAGNPWVQTPHLDALARRGVRFEHAYCQSPLCAPSRASFLTGRYPRTTRVRQNGQNIPADEVLVTRLLADAGYTGGLVGKLHISACHPNVCPDMERRVADGYAAFHWSHHPAAANSASNHPTNEYNHWLRTKGAPDYRRQAFEGTKYVQIGPEIENTQALWCAETASNFVQACAAAPKKRPWFLSVNFFDPHHPFDPPRELLERYLERVDEIPLPNYVKGELKNKPIFQSIDHRGAYGQKAGYPFSRMKDGDHRLIRAAFWAMCDLLDLAIGQIFQTLEATRQLKNTIVIFTSDHGELLGDHGMYLKGPCFYEPAVRVPLLMAGPGIGRGKTSPALVELLDLAPTLLEAAGLPSQAGMQGRSLWPLLRGKAPLGQHRDDVYCEYLNAARSHTAPTANATMLRTATHKIVKFHGTSPGELYDLEADPSETHNLWSHPDYAELKCDLLARLCDRIAWTADPLPVREVGAAW